MGLEGYLPGPLIHSAPYRDRVDPRLARLVETLRAALDPDAVELEFDFLPERRRYRRRFLGGQDSGARAVRSPRASPESPGLTLASAFRVPALVEGTLTLVRRARRPWTGAERMRFGLLQPLVSQLLECGALSEAEAGARRRLLAAAERADAPILVFDASGTILFANEAADALLSHQTEEGLAVLADDRRSTPLLSHLIRLAWLEPPPAHERLALTNGRSVEARVAPVPAASGEGAEPGVRVVTLHERAALTIDDVRPHLHARGVSDREADVVAGVLHGMRNAEIAAELFISEWTVKDHLKHVFHKLGVASRGGLIRALYAAPPAAAARERNAGPNFA